MADVSVLEVLLHGIPIGTLTRAPGDRTLFAFNEAYITDRNRPTLGLGFKDTHGQLITEHQPTHTRLMPYFSNLLPEGHLREYLAQRAEINPAREFFLLWVLGQDLPGAISVQPADGHAWPPDDDHGATADDDHDDRAHEDVLRFSLAGVQLKFSAVSEASGKLTIPAKGIGGSWIRKYVEYLEAAFLIRTLHRIDFSDKTFSRHSRFKIYLTNPSIRVALYGEPDANAIGSMIETAVACQLLNSRRPNYRFNYVRSSRGQIGEVDFVASRIGRERPVDAFEVKWTERPLSSLAREFPGLLYYANRSGLKRGYVLKRGAYESMEVDGVRIHALPISDFLVIESSFSLSQESTRRRFPADGPSDAVRRIIPWSMETFRRKPGVPWPLSN